MAVSDVMESLMAYSESFPVVYRQTRRVNLPRFPYGLYYRIVDDLIIVVACCTDGETPGRWQSRN